MADHQFVVSMATDAFRICIGMHPRTHSATDVLLWLGMMVERLAAVAARETSDG